MSLDGFQPTIVVGIGYQPFEIPAIDILNNRARDFTPIEDEKWALTAKEQGLDYILGGGGKFLGFIQDELIPYIESKYQVSPNDRTLIGHSFGGLFALYTLFKEPNLFQRNLAGSIPLEYGNEIILSMENNYSKKQKTLPVRLFLGAGSLEYDIDFNPAADMSKFLAILEERKYKELKVVAKLFDDCQHSEVVGPFIRAGLKEVFS